MELEAKLKLVAEHIEYREDTGEFISTDVKRRSFNRDCKVKKKSGFWMVRLSGKHSRIEVYCHIFVYWLKHGLPESQLTFKDGDKDNLKTSNIIPLVYDKEEVTFIRVKKSDLGAILDMLDAVGIEWVCKAKPKRQPFFNAYEINKKIEPVDIWFV